MHKVLSTIINGHLDHKYNKTTSFSYEILYEITPNILATAHIKLNANELRIHPDDRKTILDIYIALPADEELEFQDWLKLLYA